MLNAKTVNRRKGPDSLVKAISVISGLSWLFVFIAFILASYAKSHITSSNSMFLQADWGGNPAVKKYSIFLLGVVMIICFAGILINMSRHRRKTDRYNKSLIFFGVGSLIGILVYLMFG